jgi:hypothetical protein
MLHTFITNLVAIVVRNDNGPFPEAVVAVTATLVRGAEYPWPLWKIVSWPNASWSAASSGRVLYRL